MSNQVTGDDATGVAAIGLLVAGWAPVQVKREAQTLTLVLRLQGSCQGNSVKRTLINSTCGESPDPR